MTRPSVASLACIALTGWMGCLPATEATLTLALNADLGDAPPPPVDAVRLHRCGDRLGATALVDETHRAEAPLGPWCGLDVVARDPWQGEAILTDGRRVAYDLTPEDVAFSTDAAWTGTAWTLTFADGAEDTLLEAADGSWSVNDEGPHPLTEALRRVTLRATDADDDAPPLAVWPPSR